MPRSKHEQQPPVMTKPGTGVVFREVQECAKFNCPGSTVTLFPTWS